MIHVGKWDRFQDPIDNDIEIEGFDFICQDVNPPCIEHDLHPAQIPLITHSETIVANAEVSAGVDLTENIRASMHAFINSITEHIRLDSVYFMRGIPPFLLVWKYRMIKLAEEHGFKSYIQRICDKEYLVVGIYHYSFYDDDDQKT